MNTLLDVDTWRQLLQDSLAALGSSIGAFLPKLLITVVVLLLGWLIATLVALLTRRFLRRVGLDRLAERVRIARAMNNAGISATPSVIVSRLFFWLLILTFFITAANSLGLSAVTATIDRFVEFIPSVIAAGLILIAGLLLARFTRNLVLSAAVAAKAPQAHRLGSVTYGIVIIFTSVLAIEELGVDTQILVSVTTGLLTAVALSMGIAFALGARPLVTHILAGHFLRQLLTPGGSVEVDGRRGQVDNVGAFETLLRNDDQIWSIPNGTLLDSVKGR